MILDRPHPYAHRQFWNGHVPGVEAEMGHLQMLCFLCVEEVVEGYDAGEVNVKMRSAGVVALQA